MPIILSPNHPSYKTVMRRNRGAAPSSTQEGNSGGAPSITTAVVATNAPAVTGTHSYDSTSNHNNHNPLPSTPPRRRHRPSSTPSPFNLEESPELDPVFLHALAQEDTPPRSSSAISFLSAPYQRPNRMSTASSAPPHSSVVGALLPPINISSSAKERAPLRRPIARRSPLSTPTRPPSSRTKRSLPRTRQPLASIASSPLFAQSHDAQVGDRKGKGKRRADDSDDEEPVVTSPKRARTTFTAPAIVESAAKPATLEPEPAPASVKPLQEVCVPGKRKRRMEDHPSPSRLKRARFAANQPAPLLTLLENEDAAGLSQFGKPGSISPAHPVHGAQGSDSSRLTRTKRPTESRPSAAHPPALRSAHDRCAASYAQRARPSAAEARQVCFSVPQLEESPVAHICRRLQELTISAETDWALSLSADMDVDPSSFVDIDVQAQEAPAYLRPFRLDAGGDVIMHGPCTLHMPPRKPTQKAVFAGDVKRRRLKVSGKRRRSHLLQ